MLAAAGRPDADRDLTGWGTGGDRGDQGPPMVCGVSVPSGIQEPAQPPASAVLRLCKSGVGGRGKAVSLFSFQGAGGRRVPAGADPQIAR